MIQITGIDPGNSQGSYSVVRYIGIDPGNKGAIAFMECFNGVHRAIKFRDMPTIKEQVKAGCKVRTEPDFDEMIEIFQEVSEFNPEFVILEQVWGMCHDSAMTAFALGGWYKMIRTLFHCNGYALNSNYFLVSPAQWKQWKLFQRFSFWGAGKDSKLIAVEIFDEAFPDDRLEIRPFYKRTKKCRRDPMDGRADAALIALYGACEFMKLPSPATLKPLASAGLVVSGKCVLF
jgi:hypothetical protein